MMAASETTILAGVPVLGDIELLLRELKPVVYGVTGTNGKSTTTALLAHVLSNAGRTIALGGNIGTPVLALPNLAAGAGVYVLEMSSFQILTGAMAAASI